MTIRFPIRASVAVKEKITFVTVRVLSFGFGNDDTNVLFILEFLWNRQELIPLEQLFHYSLRLQQPETFQKCLALEIKYETLQLFLDLENSPHQRLLLSYY